MVYHHPPNVLMISFYLEEPNILVHDLIPRGFVSILYTSVCRIFEINKGFVKKILLNLIIICARSNKAQLITVDLKKLGHRFCLSLSLTVSWPNSASSS